MSRTRRRFTRPCGHAQPTPGEFTFAYSSDLARLLAGQLARFVTRNRHQLAGQVANLDFWAAEAQHCLDVIDGYTQRFEAMRFAQTRHAAEHRTIEFELDDPCHTESSVAPPRRVSHAELKQASRQLREAMYQFLVRCFREQLIDEPRLRCICAGLEIGVEASDLRRV